MTLVEKLADVRDFRKILETTVKEIGENYSADVCQIVLSNPLDGNFTSICEYISNPEEVPDGLLSMTFPVQPEGGGLGWLSVSRQSNLSRPEIDEIRITLANIADILRYAQINDIVQRDTFRSAFMSEITNLMSLPMGLGDALFMVVNILGKALDVSRCIFVCIEDTNWPSHSEWRSYEYWQRARIESAQEYGWPTKDSAVVAQTLLSMVPILAFEGQHNSYKTPVQEEMEFIGVRSQLSVCLRSSVGVHGTIILQQCESRHAWTRDEIDMVQNVADTVAEALAQLDEEKKSTETIMQSHQRDVADTKDPGQKSMQDVRKALKGAMGKQSIKKAQKAKPPEAAPPPPPVVSTPAASAIDFAPKIPDTLELSPEVNAGAVPDYGFAEAQNEGSGSLGEEPHSAQPFSPSDMWTEGGLPAPPEPNYDEVLDPEPEPNPFGDSMPAQNSELSGLANMLQEQATQAHESANEQPQFKGLLGGLLGNQKNAANNAGAWDIQTSLELPPDPQSVAQPAAPFPGSVSPSSDIFPPAQQSNLRPGQNVPLPGNIAAQAQGANQWGDLDSVASPGATASAGADTSAGGSKWGNLDAIGSAPAVPAPPAPAPPHPMQPAAKPASKWGDLDSIPSPGATGAPRAPGAAASAAMPGPGVLPGQSAVDGGSGDEWGSLSSIPTPVSTGKSGLGALMMGKAKASAVSGTGLGQSLHKGGVKPPAPPSFVDGPPIQMDEAAEAAAEAKLKQILASSNPTSDFIFATPGIDMRLLGRIDGWVAQIESKDKHEHGHVRAVAEYSSAVARLLGLAADEVNFIRLAAIIHDVGKLGLPKLVLQKPDEELSDAELVATMNHTIDGAKLIEEFPELAALSPIILSHHEEYDGNGYPEGRSGEAIPLGARIIHACNAYAEMVADLVYRAGMSPEQAQSNMIRGSGSTYDPAVVEALIACISQGLVPAKIV